MVSFMTHIFRLKGQITFLLLPLCFVHRCNKGSDSKESAYNARDLGTVPGSGRPPGAGTGFPLLYSCLGITWTEEPGGL